MVRPSCRPCAGRTSLVADGAARGGRDADVPRRGLLGDARGGRQARARVRAAVAGRPRARRRRERRGLERAALSAWPSTTTTRSSCAAFAATRCSAARRASCAGCAPMRVATVAQALLRALCGQLITSREARQIERRIVRATAPALDRFHAPRRPGRRSGALSPARAAAPRSARAARRSARSALPLARPRAAARRAVRGVAARLLRERGLGPWSVGVVSSRASAAGTRPRRRPRAREAARRAARAAGRGLGDGGAARAVRRVGGVSASVVPADRLGPRPRPRRRQRRAA